jgi:hypothetical protein
MPCVQLLQDAALKAVTVGAKEAERFDRSLHSLALVARHDTVSLIQV